LCNGLWFRVASSDLQSVFGSVQDTTPSDLELSCLCINLCVWVCDDYLDDQPDDELLVYGDGLPFHTDWIVSRLQITILPRS
jgi:hypothetical protein